jgi:hypothetical protein
MPRLFSGELFLATEPPDLATAWAYNSTVIEDLLFLDAWERGGAPTLSAFFRARQVRRANVVGPVEDWEAVADVSVGLTNR